MLRQNALNKTFYTRQGSNSRVLYDVESLRAAYRAVAEASAATSQTQSSSMQKTSNRIRDCYKPANTAVSEPTTSSVQTQNPGPDMKEFEFPLFNNANQPAPFQSNSATTSKPDQGRPTIFNRTQLRLDDVDNMDECPPSLPPHKDTLLVTLSSKPKPVVLIIGLCLLASSVYAGLGCWWLATGYADSAVKSANPEALNMMSVQDDNAGSTPVKKLSLKNIQAIQDQPAIIVPKETSTEPDELANATGSTDMQGTLLAQAAAPTSPNPTTAPQVTEVKASPPELTGRPDPFAPLIQINGSLPNAPTAVGTTKKDVLEDLQYTGFIGNANAKNRLAIIKVPNPAGGANLTIIKKVGAVFMVEGERIVLKGITKQALQLSVSGQNRMLVLAPYLDTVASSPSSSDSSAGSDQTASNSASAGKTTSSSTSSSTQLQEP